MDFLTFFSTLISSLAWPITVMSGVYTLKSPISKVIPLIYKIKYKDLDIEFNKIEIPAQNLDAKIADSEHQENYMLLPINSLFEIAKVSPKVAVMEAGRSIKFEFGRSIDRFVSSLNNVSGSRQSLQDDGNPQQFNPALIEMGNLLKISDDLADNPQYEVTENNAKKYIIAANRYCGLLKTFCQK